MRLPHLLLVGGGHAHLRVIREAMDTRWPGRLTLLSPSRRQTYSGMVPGYLQGTYSADEIGIDLAALCARAGAEFMEGVAVAVDGERRIVRTEGGELAFDLVSLDVGSVPQGLDLPGVREHALGLRPMSRAIELRARIDLLARAGSGAVRVAVVGAGAAGFEVALAVHRRIDRLGGAPVVTLLEQGPTILPAYSKRVRSRAARVLHHRGIRIATEAELAAVDERGAALSRGPQIDADASIWMTGPAPPPLLANSILPLSTHGYFAVDETLRAVDGAPIWGAGDCVSVSGHNLPKAGVYAVRQGPILARNLRAAAEVDHPVRYRPQASFLSLLNTADGRALLRWQGIVSHSRVAWWLKDHIDRRFVAGCRL